MALQLQPLVTPFLFLDGAAEAAARFYCGVFPASAIVDRAPPAADGSAQTITIDLAGQHLLLCDGRAPAPLTPAVSLFVRCATQREVDHYWQALGEGGEPRRGGWLRDRFGVYWQIVPERLAELLTHPDPRRTRRVMLTARKMVKLDIATLENAHDYA